MLVGPLCVRLYLWIVDVPAHPCAALERVLNLTGVTCDLVTGMRFVAN